MAVKKTIAIVAAAGKIATTIANKLAQQNYRLLLISKDVKQFTQLSAAIQNTVPGAETEVLDCVKDGCWEADIIILFVPVDAEKEVAEMIQEVATQKIVVSISGHENNNADEVEQLQKLLPHSKVVKVFINSKSLETFMEGDDEEALQTVSNILRAAGYHLLVNNLSADKKM